MPILLLAACAKPVDLNGAIAFVRPLYSDAQPDTSPDGLRRLYTPDLAAALSASMAPDKPDPLGFDMRYGDVVWKVQALSFSAKPAAGGAVVAARFKSFNLPTEVDWRLASTPAGWRIAEVSAPMIGDLPAWSLRTALGLPPVH